MEPIIKIIGVIHSPLKRIEDCPLQENEDAPEATIEIYDAYKDAVKDIKSNARLILFTWLHQSDRSVLTTHPRNDLNVPLTGVFSTRSPDRPNPIGIHFVKVISVGKNDQLKITGLEVLDQTPLIDIKPDIGK